MRIALLLTLLFCSVKCFSQVISPHTLIGAWATQSSLYPNNFEISFFDTLNAIVIKEYDYNATYTLKNFNNKTLLILKGKKKLPCLDNRIKTKEYTVRFIIDSIGNDRLELELLNDSNLVVSNSILTRQFLIQ